MYTHVYTHQTVAYIILLANFFQLIWEAAGAASANTPTDESIEQSIAIALV